MRQRGLTDDSIILLIPALNVGHHAMRKRNTSFDGGVLETVNFANDTSAYASEREHSSHSHVHDKSIAVVEQHLVLLKVGGDVGVIIQAAPAQLSSATVSKISGRLLEED